MYVSKMYDRKGERIDMDHWSKLLRDPKYRQVRHSTLLDGVRVSTVWLGQDHAWDGGRPLIFESMVFKGDKSNLDCERYSTEEEAIAGHERMVEKWLLKTGDDE